MAVKGTKKAFAEAVDAYWDLLPTQRSEKDAAAAKIIAVIQAAQARNYQLMPATASNEQLLRNWGFQGWRPGR